MKRFGNIPYNLTFTTLMITIISWDYLNLSVANECVGDVIIATGLCSITNDALGRSTNHIGELTSN